MTQEEKASFLLNYCHISPLGLLTCLAFAFCSLSWSQTPILCPQLASRQPSPRLWVIPEAVASGSRGLDWTHTLQGHGLLLCGGGTEANRIAAAVPGEGHLCVVAASGKGAELASSLLPQISLRAYRQDELTRKRGFGRSGSCQPSDGDLCLCPRCHGQRGLAFPQAK